VHATKMIAPTNPTRTNRFRGSAGSRATSRPLPSPASECVRPFTVRRRSGAVPRDHGTRPSGRSRPAFLTGGNGPGPPSTEVDSVPRHDGKCTASGVATRWTAGPWRLSSGHTPLRVGLATRVARRSRAAGPAGASPGRRCRRAPGGRGHPCRRRRSRTSGVTGGSAQQASRPAPGRAR
jgi:hypothetical protein